MLQAGHQQLLAELTDLRERISREASERSWGGVEAECMLNVLGVAVLGRCSNTRLMTRLS